jgi:hypothetical protein
MMILEVQVQSKAVDGDDNMEGDTPAHHVQEVGQLEEAAHVRVDLDGEVLQLLLGRVYPKQPKAS